MQATKQAMDSLIHEQFVGEMVGYEKSSTYMASRGGDQGIV